MGYHGGAPERARQTSGRDRDDHRCATGAAGARPLDRRATRRGQEHRRGKPRAALRAAGLPFRSARTGALRPRRSRALPGSLRLAPRPPRPGGTLAWWLPRRRWHAIHWPPGASGSAWRATICWRSPRPGRSWRRGRASSPMCCCRSWRTRAAPSGWCRPPRSRASLLRRAKLAGMPLSDLARARENLHARDLLLGAHVAATARAHDLTVIQIDETTGPDVVAALVAARFAPFLSERVVKRSPWSVVRGP